MSGHVHSPLRASEPEVTGAALGLLDAHLFGLRERILKEAARNGLGGPGDGRIGIVEVQAAISRIRTADKVLPRAAFELFGKLARPVMVYAATLLLAGVTAATTYFAVNASGSRPTHLIFAALGLLSGLTVVAAGSFGFEVRRAKRWRAEHQAIIASREFVRRMARLEENCIRSATLRSKTDTVTPLGLGKALTILESCQIWALQDVETFRQLLRLRNEVVHEDALALGNDDVAFALAEISRLAGLLDSSTGAGR